MRDIIKKSTLLPGLLLLLATALPAGALTLSESFRIRFDSSVGNHAADDAGRTVAVGLWDNSVHIYRQQEGRLTLLQKLTGHLSKVLRISVSNDGSHILSVSGDYTKYDYRPRVWKLLNGRYTLLQVLPRHTQPVFGAAISRDGSRLVTAGKYARFYLKQGNRYAPVLQLTAPGSTGEYSGAAWARDTDTVALRTSRAVFIYNFSGNRPTLVQQLATQGYTGKIAFSNDGRWLVANGKNLTLWKRNGNRFVPVTALAPPRSWEQFRHGAFSPDSKRLWGSSNGHSLMAWDLSTGNPVKVYEKNRRNYDISHIVATADGRLVLLNYRTLKVWKINSSGQPGNSNRQNDTGSQNGGNGDGYEADDPE